MAKRSYAGGAVTGTLTAGINASDLAVTADTLAGWPVGAGDGPFAAVIDQDTITEEKVLCTSRNGNTITISSRGYDGTTAKTHSSGAKIKHCITSVDVSESNAHIQAVAGVHGLTGQDAVVGVAKVATLTGKTMSGADNTFSSIPASASPQTEAAIAAVQAEVDAEEIARAAGDTARYTKAEADALFTTDAEADAIADVSSAAAVAAHGAAGDPHAQYLTQAEGDAAFLTQAEGDARYPLDANLTGFSRMHVGRGTFTPNANGRIVFAHGAPFDPDYMLINLVDAADSLDATGGKIVNAEQGSSNATTVAVRVYRNDNGNPVTANTSLRWIAILE